MPVVTSSQQCTLFPLLPSCPCTLAQPERQARVRIHPQAVEQALEKASNSSLSITARLYWALPALVTSCLLSTEACST